MSTHPWIIAHRGAVDEAPENTMAAFEAALRHAIDGIELDVQMSRDGELVIYHDADLAKLGRDDVSVANLALRDLRELASDPATRNSPRGSGSPTALLPLFHDVIRALSPRTRVLVEIKSFAEDRRSGRELELTKRVLQALATAVAPADRGHVLILSFDATVLRHVHDHASWPCVLNMEGKAVPAEENARHLYACCAAIDVTDPTMVAAVHSRGQKFMTYSCNHEAAVGKAIDCDCDVIMTDRPGWLAGYLSRGQGK